MTPNADIVVKADKYRCHISYSRSNPNINTFYPYGFNDIRYDVTSGDNVSLSIPRDDAHRLPKFFADNHPTLKIFYDPELLAYIEKVLSAERKAYALAIADDADLPKGVLSIEPLPHQRAAIAFHLEHNRSINGLEMGLGKTLVAAWIAKYHAHRTLWITKAALVPNLRNEIRKLTGDIPCVLSGRAPGRSDIEAMISDQFQHFIINYEVIGTEHREDHNGVIKCTFPWIDLFNTMAKVGRISFVVADEVHNCRNLNAQRTRALLKLNIPNRLPMTGTTITNRLADLWPALHWVDAERFPSEASFLNAHIGYNGRIRNPTKLQQELVRHVFRRRKADVIKDLPPIIDINHVVELSPLHKERYDTALRGLFQKWNGDVNEISNALVQLNRLREVVADAKADACIEYITDMNEQDESAKTIIFTNFVIPAKQIAAELGCDLIYSDVPQEERIHMVDRFNSDPSIRNLVLTMGTGQEGLNITGATHVMFVDFAWTPGAHSQAIARTYGRLNDLHGATVIWVSIENTVDAIIADVLARKRAIIATVDGVTAAAMESESIIKEVLARLRDSM